MNNFNVIYTNVNSPDFRTEIENVKRDGKENLITVNKESGIAKIYTFDNNTSSDLKKGMAINEIAFDDFDYINPTNDQTSYLTEFENKIIIKK